VGSSQWVLVGEEGYLTEKLWIDNILDSFAVHCSPFRISLTTENRQPTTLNIALPGKSTYNGVSYLLFRI
jgi:hypothetical protein